MTDAYSAKPAFDPSQPFEPAAGQEKPPFDPSKPFDAMDQKTAALEGYLSGASAGFRDEVYGASEASGLPRALGGFRAPVGAVKLAYEKITGEPGEATATYERARDEKRRTQKEAQEQFPKTFLAGQVGGALVLPGGAATRGGTMGVRALRSAGVGGAYGGLSGLGEGEGLSDSLTKGVAGVPLGAAVGAAGVPLVEGAIQGARALTGPITTALRGAINPEAEAGRRVAGAIERDIQVDPAATSRLTQQEFAANAQPGGPASIMDLGGETTRGLARSAANTSPEGRQALTRSIDDRYEGQSWRVTDWLQNTFNFPDARARQEAIEQAATATNRPAYQRAFATHDGPMWDQQLGELAQDPVVQSAIRRAQVTVRTSRTRDGFAPMNTPFEFEQSSGRLTQRRDPNGNPIYPDLRFWDSVKRELDKTNSPDARAFARVLRSHLDDLTTDAAGTSLYQQARTGAAQFFGAENALEAGQNFVTSKLANGEARAALARMPPHERQLFQDGFVSRFVEAINETGDRRNVLNTIAQSPAARERLLMVLGHQRATELEAVLRVEGIMDMSRGAVTGNSTTARQLAELGLAGGAGSLGAYGAYNLNPTEMTYAAVAGALLAGNRRIDQRVAQHVAQMLVSRDPQVLARGLSVVARNHRFIDALRTTDLSLARVGGEQSAKVPALQAAGIGRADQNDPNVPRPPGQ